MEYHTYPTILHAHGFDKDSGKPVRDKDGKQWNKTWQALTRFHSNRNIKRISLSLKDIRENGVFLTLTVDRSKTLKESWQTITKDWNKFITRLKVEIKRSGGTHNKNLRHLAVLEAQSDSFPHINAVFLGLRWLFYAGNKRDWETDNPRSKNLKHFWGRGSVFVNATKEGQTVINHIGYIMKYIRKTMEQHTKDSKAVLTQAMLWAFNKRSFFVSRAMSEWIKKKVPDRLQSIRWKLYGLAKTEFWTGQKTPIVRIVAKKLPPDHRALRPVVTQMESVNGEVFEIFSRDITMEQLPLVGKTLKVYWRNKSTNLYNDNG